VLGRLGVTEPVEEPLPLVVGRVEGPLLLELGRLTDDPVRPLELVPVLGRLGVTEPVEVPLGRLGVAEPVEAPLPLLVLWLPPELMLPLLVFGRTVAVGAGLFGAGSAGGVTLWVAG